MHELPVTESILEIALRHADAAGATMVSDIHLIIGQLSSIVDDSVQFYWDIVSDGTIAKGAILHFRRLPARMYCRECEREYTPAKGSLICPDCGGVDVKILSGDEFRVEAIEVETDQAPENTGGQR
jgi:hydrogenase nickel incorporation protein HypA/HybF